jgi:hypothetical protein
MKKWICIAGVLAFMLSGCKSTEQSKEHVSSSVSGYEIRWQDKVKKTSPPKSIKKSTMEANKFYMSDEELVSLKNNEFDFGYLLIQKARLTHQEVDTLSDWGNYIQKGSGAIFNTSSSSSNVHPTLYDAFKRFCKIGGGLIVNEVSSSPHHRKNDLLKYHHICSKEGLFQSVLVVEESTLKQKY